MYKKFLYLVFPLLMLAGALLAQPVISSVSPLAGYPASTVTITGTGFNATAANDIVFFGATRATVSAASSTSLTVTIPADATYMPVTVLNTATHLTGFSQYNFLPTFDNTIYSSPGVLAFNTKVDFTAATNPTGIAVGDLDGDGKADLAVANFNSGSVSVYRNTSSAGSISAGSFAAKVDYTIGTTAYPSNVAIGDIDGDGKPELVVSNHGTNNVSVLRNTATSGTIDASSFATHVDFTTGNIPKSVAIGDVDGDGKPDLVTANSSSNTISVLRNTATSGSITTGSFATKVDLASGTGTYNVVIADLDGDGKPDLAAANNGDSTVSVFRNTCSSGTISFATRVNFATGSPHKALAAGDLDGDGKPDLAVADSGTNTVSVFRNTATSGALTTGSFAARVAFATGSTPTYIAIGDFNGDGKPDLATANSGASTVSILRNTATSGTITTSSFAAKIDTATGTGPRNLAIGDLDGDGKPDIIVTNYTVSTVSIIRNNLAYIPPTITSVSPNSAKPGDTVTITGTGFNTAAASNTVYFGATKAAIPAATATSMTAIVPYGAYYAPVSELNTISGLSAREKPAPFNPVYNNSYFAAGSINFKPAVNFTTGTSPFTGAIGDLDGDGKPDLVINNKGDNTVSIYRNTSSTGAITSSSFTAVSGTFATASGPGNVKLADIDGDGKLDIITPNATSATVSVLRNTSISGTISFAAKVDFSTSATLGLAPIVVTINDFDGDGRPDVAVSAFYSSRISILRNTATVGAITSSSFAAAVTFACGSTPFGICNADFDGDGLPDIATADTAAAAVSVFRNTSTSGTLSFAAKVDFTAGSEPIDIQVADMDGDGKTDLVLTTAVSKNVSVLRNTATSGAITSGSFAAKVDFYTGYALSGIAVGDIDGDGKPDLVTANTDSGTVSVFRNTAVSGSFTTGSLAAKVNFAAGYGPTGINIGDVDGDGRPDIVVGNQFSNTVSVLKNYPLPQIAAITGADTICAGSTATYADAVTGGYWTVTNSHATVSAAGVVTAVSQGRDTIKYTIVAGGDTASVIKAFTVQPLPVVAAITGADSICAGATAIYTDATSGGVWRITNAHATIAGSTVTGVSQGADTVTYTVTAYGCSTTMQRGIYIRPLPAVSVITGPSSVCAGSSIALSDSAAGGMWSSSNAAIATVSSTGTVTGVAAGIDTIFYTITNSCGAAVANKAITVNPLPVAGTITGPDTICTGAAVPLSETVTGGTWSSSNAAVATINASGIVTGVSAGMATISYTVSNTCGMAIATKGITVGTAPVAGTISGRHLFAPADTATFTDATAGGVWSSINTAVATVSATGLVTAVAAGTDTIKYTVTGSCGSTAATYYVQVLSLDTWTGTTSTSWTDTANWSAHLVPTATVEVTIPAGTPYSPAISTAALTDSISIAAGATLTINASYTLNIKGNLTNNGKITGAGAAVLSGGYAQLIKGVGAVSNLTLNNIAGASINFNNDTVNITGTLTLTRGTFTTTNALVLYSDAAGTGRIAAIPASGAGISGSVTTLQYIQGGRRAYRFLGHPFSSYIPLSQIEQYIDVTGTGGSTNGFTSTVTNAASAYWYNPLYSNSALASDPGWRAFTSAYGTPDTNKFKRYEGIRMLVRGAKGEGLDGAAYTPSATTIGMYGAVNTGDQYITLTKGTGANQDYNMIANPYPSQTDIGTVIANAQSAGLVAGTAFYVWNPYLATSGMFMPVTIGSPYIIEANTSYQVRTTANGNMLHFTEANKSNGTYTTLLKQQPQYLSLYIYDSSYHLWDMSYIKFNDAATEAEDNDMDARKAVNTDLNFYSISADGQKLSIDARPYDADKVVPLGITSSYRQQFIIKVENYSVPDGAQIYLHDKLLQAYTLLQKGAEYRFAITGDTNTQGTDRFELSMKPAAVATALTTGTLDVKMIPNPATDAVNITYSAPAAAQTNVNIIDATGATVITRALGTQATGTITIPVSKLPTGVYLVEVISGGSKAVQRLVKE